MSNTEAKKITDRQAEARRQNGRKSRGPKTPEGKFRSSMNATKHGMWARGLVTLQRGALEEDAGELERFVLAVLAELDPGESTILNQMAIDVIDKAWRVPRAQDWQVTGYERQDPIPDESANTVTATMRIRRSSVSLGRDPVDDL